MASNMGDEVKAISVRVLDRRSFIKATTAVAAALALPGITQAQANSSLGSSASGKRVLVINAHQTWKGMSEGRLNKTMAQLISDEMAVKGYEVKSTYIEDHYEIQDEVEKHVWADVIITQSPVYWFGTPWLYKKYIDEVFTEGLMQKRFLVGDGRSRDNPELQYGSGGKMQGKKYMLSLTMNAPKESFDDPKQRLHSGSSVDALFACNTANYKFCGVDILPAFACFDVMKAPQINDDKERLKVHLRELFG